MQQQGDSYNYYTENIGSKKLFFKEYRNNHISKTIVEIYHALHRYTSKQTKEVYFGDITLDGQKIDTRKIRILELDPTWVHEATEITTKEHIVITNPDYIPGKTLKEYEDQLWTDMTLNICDAISRHIETITKVNFTDMYGVAPINVKIIIKDNRAELIVTDMSCNIRSFFHSWKNAVILDQLLHKAS